MLGMVKFVDALLVLLRLVFVVCSFVTSLRLPSFFFLSSNYPFSFRAKAVIQGSMQTSRALPTHPIVLIDDDLDLYSQAGSSMSSPFVF